MNKILIIFQKEYLTRVRNKTFILSTFLLPVILALFIAGVVYFATHSSEKTIVAVNDVSDEFTNNLKSDSSEVTFVYNDSITGTNFSAKGFNAVLIIPKYDSLVKDTIRLISEKELGLNTQEYVRSQL